MRHQIGEFEELVMLTVAVLHGEAYAIAIIDEIHSRVNRKVSIGALQTVLRRLESKGYLESELGEATNVRGGKRKRFYTVTKFGQRALEEIKEQRMNLWRSIPKISFSK